MSAMGPDDIRGLSTVQRGLLMAALASSLLALVWSPDGGLLPYHLDFDVYRTGAQVLLSGGDIYGELPTLAHGDKLPFTYPPFAAVLFGVFTLVPLPSGSLILTFASLACIWWLTIVAATCNSAGSSRTPSGQPAEPSGMTTMVLIALLLAPWCGPVLHTVRYGQINIILTTLVMIDALGSLRNRRWAGILTGLAAAIKLTPAVFVLFFVLRKDWRAAARMVVAALISTGIGFLAAPTTSANYWTVIIRDAGRIGDTWAATNLSWYGALSRWGLVGQHLNSVWLATCVATGLLIAVLSHRLIAAGYPIVAAETIGVIALLCSPHRVGSPLDHDVAVGDLMRCDEPSDLRYRSCVARDRFVRSGGSHGFAPAPATAGPRRREELVVAAASVGERLSDLVPRCARGPVGNHRSEKTYRTARMTTITT